MAPMFFSMFVVGSAQRRRSVRITFDGYHELRQVKQWISNPDLGQAAGALRPIRSSFDRSSYSRSRTEEIDNRGEPIFISIQFFDPSREKTRR